MQDVGTKIGFDKGIGEDAEGETPMTVEEPGGPSENGPGMEWIDRIISGMSPEEVSYALDKLEKAEAAQGGMIDLKNIDMPEPEVASEEDEEGDEYA